MMEDVQSHAPQVALNIDRVGVRDLHLPLLVRDRSRGSQQTVAKVDLGVDLPSSFKGTHMSRFVEALHQHGPLLDVHTALAIPFRAAAAPDHQGTPGRAPGLCLLQLSLFYCQKSPGFGQPGHRGLCLPSHG